MKFAHVFMVSLSTLALSVSALAANGSPSRCAERVRQAGCYLSNNDFDRIIDNTEMCKHVDSDSGRNAFEIFLLDQSQTIVVTKTKGRDVSSGNCPTVKYMIDTAGIKEVKVINGKVYMNSDDGALYYFDGDRNRVYEVLNSSGRSYKGVTDIKGYSDRQTRELGIELVFQDGNRLKMSDEKLDKKIADREVREVRFEFFHTDRSLFRDEAPRRR